MTQTSTERHPDIEIYIKQRSVEQISTWLEAEFDRLELLQQRGQTYRYQANLDGTQIPITLIDRAAKDFSSLWFDSDSTRWPQDRDCARQACQQLETEIRCIASGWNEGDEPDEWWSIKDSGEQLILWRG
ncbi:hypothetical protein DV711_18550 [Motiliproteus coralliicola]|uniref:Uncharacterized protein n=1 Tax=Motiliproteus coralliicola TaxID=2283196 RepID=A0A369W8Z2_9GAMM|nr:hypothetical protein [Motiliproteus coralliicola]RDE18117.1 hypothetical protein DV711_18550 [Motiliproteus coralliicola]